MKCIKYLLIAFLLMNCSKSTEIGFDCEVVVNADGPGYLKVINQLDSKVEVFLSEYAFAAIIRTNTCEIYGLDPGSRKAEISICADGDCKTYSDKKDITFLIHEEETYTVEISEAFFKN